MNKVILIGNLAADPELRRTASDVPVCTFRLAVQRRFSNAQGVREADFFTIVAWRQTAEFISKFFRKGASICVTGSLQSRSWTDNQGQKRYATEVVVDEAMFVDSKTDGVAGGQYETYNAPSYSSSPASAPKFEELKTDDDLPF
jgi:single-strand DNA-binding protein